MRFLTLVLALAAFGSLSAQISRSDLETKTRRGVSLMDNGKLEDAIEIFNEILTKDPTEGKALLLRARTKLELGAYKGAKKDCFAYMDIYGVDAPVAGMLGKTEKAMENYKQALSYLKTALLFDEEGIEYLMDRADIFYNLGLDDKACADWYVAAEVGSVEASRLMKANCKAFLAAKEKPKKQRPTRTDDEYRSNDSEDDEGEDFTRNSSDDEYDGEEDGGDSSTDDSSSQDEEEVTDSSGQDDEPEFVDTDIEEEEVIEEIPEENYPLDESVEEVYIDEDLTIVLADGIGSRKLVEKPDILILSDKTGVVVVNVCIDRLGRVQNPTLNENYSTIQASSLISLALRESSNFRFARSSRKSHCGTITYKITGSE